jgi:ribose transport system permease protein
MTELTQKQQTPPLHYYHDVKWRLLAEVPWLLFTLLLAVSLSFRILLSKGRFAPDTIPNIVILGSLVIPMIIIIASGDADLSLGTLVGLVCQIVESLHWRLGLGPAMLVSLLVALVVGLTNGLLVAFGRLKGIYVTFGMSYVLLGLIYELNTLMIPTVPANLAAMAHSSLILWLWISLVLVCAALMIFTSLGRRSQAGEPEPSNRSRLLKMSLFVFSSCMAWISGTLLLGWLGSATIWSTADFTEIALLATLAGGTAYNAGTGFVLSGAIALIAISLFRQVLHLLHLPTAEERIVLGALMLIMLPITQYYHVGMDWLYRRQSKKSTITSSEIAPNRDNIKF